MDVGACACHREQDRTHSGVFHHVMIRGIERGRIFRDNQGRHHPLKRLDTVLRSKERSSDRGRRTGPWSEVQSWLPQRKGHSR